MSSCSHVKEGCVLHAAGEEFKTGVAEAYHETSQELPDAYLTPLPVLHRDDFPVRELNTGEVFRESGTFGIHRVLAGVGELRSEVVLGQYVQFLHPSGVWSTPGGVTVGRVIAFYVSQPKGALCFSARIMIPTTALEEQDLEASIPPPVAGFSACFWDSDVVEDHLPTSLVLSVAEMSTVARSSGGQGRWLIQGFYSTRDEEFEFPWKSTRRHGELGLTDENGVLLKSFNQEHLPVANMGLVMWEDDFQTFNGRQHSTTTCAFTYSVLPFRLRMSAAWIRVFSYVPPGVDITEANRLMLWCLTQMERGVVVKAWLGGALRLVYLRCGIYLFLSDSPFTAILANTLKPTATMPCHICHILAITTRLLTW